MSSTTNLSAGRAAARRPARGPAKRAPLLAPKTKKRAYKGERTLRSSVVLGIIIFNVVLLVIPIGIAFVGSFHQWNPLNSTFTFLGLQNYITLMGDATFWSTARNTGIFGVVVIFFRVVLGLALAVAVYSKITRGKTFFRTLFYMPIVTPLVAVAYVWKLMYNPQSGAINSFLGLDINWLFDSSFALPAVMLMTIWKDFGYAFILFLAGLHSLPEDALEAASIDGASAWQRFWYVVLPLLKPMMLFVIVTSIISYLQAFVQVLVLTDGGPGTATYIISYYLYEKAFVQYDFGYASAIAFVLLLATGLLTLLAFFLSGGKALFGRTTK